MGSWRILLNASLTTKVTKQQSVNNCLFQMKVLYMFPLTSTNFLVHKRKSNVKGHICISFFDNSWCKPFMAAEGGARSLINCSKWCHLSRRQSELKTTSLKIKKFWGCEVGNKQVYKTSVATPHICWKLEASDYIRRYWQNTPDPLTEQSLPELHCG